MGSYDFLWKFMGIFKFIKNDGLVCIIWFFLNMLCNYFYCIWVFLVNLEVLMNLYVVIKFGDFSEFGCF